MSVTPQWVFIVGILLAVALAVGTAVPQITAHANGRVVEFEVQRAGPYEIAVGTIPETPRVGNLHLTLAVTDALSGMYFLTAGITVTGIGPASEAVEIGPLTALNNPGEPAFYDVSTSVDRVGTWNFTVAVSSDLGEASADFPIEVRGSSPMTGIILLVALLAFLSVTGFSIRIYLRERGKGRRVGKSRL